jgi:serine/threonine protein kinase
MHTLGIAHNNIRPTNIMMDGDMPIIIDFASTLSFGKGLAGWRAGSQPWIPPEAIASDEYNDHYAAQQIYHWLRA